MERQEEIRASDVAVVGMACRFPGAPTAEKFWQNLQEGRETTTFFSDEELLAGGADPDLLRDPRYVKAGQILPDVDRFDADLFKLTSDEAEILDPQQKQFLECALEALESAGYDQETYPGSIGVYAGVGMNTYLLRNLGERYRKASSLDRYRLMLANDKDFLATRVSYKLNLRGPSVNINTACSTSLVAVHLACMGLLSGECDMALVGAAHIKIPQVEGYVFQEGMIFSPDGHCRAFDAKAQGTIVGNGIGIVVLKRLQDAIADGDWVHAIIKGTAINNDGARKASYTAPSVEGQSAIIAEAQMLAGCDADTISYIEAHGTGTALGDPIEFTALKQAFALGTTRKGYCAIGSVKTNVGHLDVAAGMAGLIKTCLMLEHKRLVASLHFERPNPEIDFEESPFYVNTALKEWTTNGTPRRAGVSSFGIGGTNAHVVLEEAPRRRPAASEEDCQLLVVSARSFKSLDETANELARHLKQHPGLNLGDVAYTLSAGRRAYAHRLALVSGNLRDAALTLTLGDEDRVLKGQAGGTPREVVFIFSDGLSDQGTRAVELYQSLPAFRKIVGRTVVEFGVGAADDAMPLFRAGNATAAFLAQYALAELWRSWGVCPTILAGFGAGRSVAECMAGKISVAAALDYARGRDEGLSPLDSSAAPPEPMLLSNADGRWVGAQEASHPIAWVEPPPGAMGMEACLMRLLDGTHHLSLPVEADDKRIARSARAALLHNLGRLWVSGVSVNWLAVYSDEGFGRVPLPSRPFERKRFWFDARNGQVTASETDRPRLRQQVEAAVGSAKSQLIIEFIQREIARILGADAASPLDADANLFDLGIDSLILIEIAAKLSTEIEHAVSPSLFVDYFTIRTFAVNLLVTLGYFQDSGKGSLKHHRLP